VCCISWCKAPFVSSNRRTMRDPNAVVPPPLSREEQAKLHKGLGRKRLPMVIPMVAAHERDDISAKVQEDRHQEEDSHMQEEWQS